VRLTQVVVRAAHVMRPRLTKLVACPRQRPRLFAHQRIIH